MGFRMLSEIVDMEKNAKKTTKITIRICIISKSMDECKMLSFVLESVSISATIKSAKMSSIREQQPLISSSVSS